jgi:P27 family predicted phage terminase small subunit
MAKPGRPPVPTKILEARGSRWAERRDGEVQFPPGAPGCPEWLSPEAKAEWKRVCADLEASGVLCRVDRAMLTAYCEAWAEFHEAEKEVQESGRTYETVTGQRKVSPWVQVKNAASARLERLSQQFGFSPSARARVKGPDRPAGDGEGKGRFFKAG